jgi:hydroxyacyl-ACP dehydratase HTD2-like protein with hotdog domain
VTAPQSALTGQQFEDRVFEDTAEGEVIGPVTYGPMTVMHLVRWCAAMENWHRIHYDFDFCRNHEGLPGPLINGSWKQQALAQLLKDWAGHTGWLASLKFQFRGMDVVGQALTVQARVTAREQRGDYGEIRCAVEVTNSSGQATTTGEATVVLPLRDGPAVPYSFPSAGADEAVPGPGAGHELCPPEYRRYIGLTSDVLVTPEPVDASSVRRFMQAIMASDPDCYDATGPGSHRYGGVVASPLYPLHALHDPAGARDPLEAALGNPGFDGNSQTAWSGFGLPELEGAPKRILNAGNEIQLHAYAPLGSRIAVSSTYDDIYQKAGKSGPLLFVSTLSRYSVHETGQPLLQSRQVLILR